MANRRDLMKKAHMPEQKSDLFQLTDGVVSHDRLMPSHIVDHGPDEDDEEEEEYEDDDDDDDDDESEDEDDDEDEDEDENDDEGDEEDSLRDNKSIHFTSGFNRNPLMAGKMMKQFCKVHLFQPCNHQRRRIKSATKGESYMAYRKTS